MGKTYRKIDDSYKKKNRRNQDSHVEYIPDIPWDEIETPQQRVERLKQIDKDMWNMHGRKDV